MAKKVLLKDVATLLNGRAYKQDELLDSGKYPVLRVGNFFSNRGWFYSDLELEDDKYCDNGDLLFAWSASFGPKIWDGGKVIYHYHIWKILTTPQIDKKYFYYYLENAADRIKESGHGIAMIHTTKGEMEQMELLLPEMRQQLQIASVLDKVSELITLRKEQLAKLDRLVKSRFIELFGDLKTNPHNWQCHSLLDVAEIDTTMVTDYGKYADYPHIGIDSIEKNTGRLFGYRTIAEDRVISGKYLFTSKHIIYSKIRPNLNKVALPSFEGLCSADAYPILPKENICLRIYLGYVMRSEFFLDYILPFSRRANMPKVNKEQLSGFVLPVPPIDLQNQFAAFVEQTDKSKLAIQQSLDKLELLKKSLMQEYFG